MHPTRILAALALASLSTLLACAGTTPRPAGGESVDAGATSTAVTDAATTGTPCGEGPHAVMCAEGQQCCAGGPAGSYYCASLRDGEGCPPLP
jgi:hypothetical protein